MCQALYWVTEIQVLLRHVPLFQGAYSQVKDTDKTFKISINLRNEKLLPLFTGNGGLFYYINAKS